MTLKRLVRGGMLAAGVACAAARPAVALEGLVRLPDGAPAAYAEVLISGQSGIVRTGSDGVFSWAPDPAAPFEVIIVLAEGAYAAPVQVEQLPAPGMRLELTARRVVSEALTIRAVAPGHTEAPPASAASVVLREAIAQERPANVTQAILSLPGTGRIEEGQSAVPSLRGLARGRTLVLIDGTRVTAERRAGPSATYLDPAVLDSIEVSRGPGSVAYGSDAFGGVVHARTRSVAADSGWRGRLESAFGTADTHRTASGALTRGFGEGGVLLFGRWRKADDYRSPQDTVPNSAFRDAGGGARLDTAWGPGRLRVAGMWDAGRDIGKPALDALVVRAYYPREDSRRFTIGYEGTPRAGLLRWGAQAFVGTYRLVTTRDRAATATTAQSVQISDAEADDWGVRVTGATEIQGWRLGGGLDANGRHGLSARGTTTDYGATVTQSEEIAVDTARREDLGVYLTLDGRLLSHAQLSAGLRQDHVVSRNRGGFFGDRRQQHGATSGSVALIAGPVQALTLTAQVSRGFRDPTLSDRYYRGISGRGFVVGNPDLRPEYSTQYDLALRHTGRRMRAAVYAYRYEIRDLVERFRNGVDFAFRNRGEARIHGLELEGQLDLERGWGLELSAQTLRGRVIEEESPLTDIPPRGLTLTMRKAWAARASAFVRAVLRSPRSDFGPTEKATPGYGTLEAGGTWRLRRNVEARLTLGNLLDHSYPGTPDELATLAPGRSAIVSVSAGF